MMLTRLQCEIVRACGLRIDRLTREMRDRDELFASPNTLAAVEAQLLAAARTLAHLAPVLRTRLAWVDWHGWQRLLDLIEEDWRPRREEVWYAIASLLPATLHLIEQLRRVEPVWFEIDY